MRVRQRKRRQKRERQTTDFAQAAPDHDPVVVLVVSLLPPTPVTDDGLAQAIRAIARKVLTDLGPILFQVVLGRRKWDKENCIIGGSVER